MFLADNLIAGQTVDFFEGDVAPFHFLRRVEDEDAVSGGIEQRIEALFFVGDLPIKLGVEHGNGGLVCKGLQQHAVIGRERVGIIAEDENDADHLSLRGEGQTRPVEQSHADGVGQFLQHAVEFAHIQFHHLFLSQQGREVTQKRRSDPMRGRNAPAFGSFERDESRLPRQHFNRDAQNSRQQFLQVQFLGEQARNFEQIIPLADAEIREHRGNDGHGFILSPG